MDQTNVRVVSVKDPASDRHVGQLYRPRIVVSVGSHRLQNMVKSVCFHKKEKILCGITHWVIKKKKFKKGDFFF